MSTLSEIEAAMAALSPAERVALERRLHEMNLAQHGEGKVFTGDDAVVWWTEREHMQLDEGEAFARDVEAARRELAGPPNAPRWD
jgi:hypothetical protein